MTTLRETESLYWHEIFDACLRELAFNSLIVCAKANEIGAEMPSAVQINKWICCMLDRKCLDARWEVGKPLHNRLYSYIIDLTDKLVEEKYNESLI